MRVAARRRTGRLTATIRAGSAFRRSRRSRRRTWRSLQVAWTYHMRPAAAAEGSGRFAGSEVTPLVVDGLMYVTTPYRRVLALDPDSGREVWAYEVPGPGQPSLRGVEYWPGTRAIPAANHFRHARRSADRARREQRQARSRLRRRTASSISRRPQSWQTAPVRRAPSAIRATA